MNVHGKWFGILVAVGCCALSPAWGAEPDAAPAGDYRDVTFRALDDPARMRLSDFSGRVVLVNFWASWCVPCRREMPALQRLHQDLHERGLDVVAIAVYDELAQAQRFRSRYRLSIPMYFDDQAEVRRVFGVMTIPETWLIGRDGRLVPVPDPTTGVLSS